MGAEQLTTSLLTSLECKEDFRLDIMKITLLL